jgi:hypothetical protein
MGVSAPPHADSSALRGASMGDWGISAFFTYFERSEPLLAQRSCTHSRSSLPASRFYFPRQSELHVDHQVRGDLLQFSSQQGQ